jgi:N-acyl-D-aspartate/D-glutamate deacylase
MVAWEPRTTVGEVADCAGEMGTRSRVGVPIGIVVEVAHGAAAGAYTEREIGASTITQV